MYIDPVRIDVVLLYHKPNESNKVLRIAGSPAVEILAEQHKAGKGTVAQAWIIRQPRSGKVARLKVLTTAVRQVVVIIEKLMGGRSGCGWVVRDRVPRAIRPIAAIVPTVSTFACSVHHDNQRISTGVSGLIALWEQQPVVHHEHIVASVPFTKIAFRVRRRIPGRHVPISICLCAGGILAKTESDILLKKVIACG